MRINTEFEWWQAAGQLADMLSTYLNGYRITWNRERFFQLKHNKDFENAWRQFQEAWEALPDHPGIRTGPFFLLADVCSEGMQFLDDEQAAVERSIAHITKNRDPKTITRM